MSISREQVADLRPGDVVELRDEQWAEGSVIRGPLQEDNRHLMLCRVVTIRHPDGSPGHGRRTLTVVSRIPRPLYVNHARTEPVPGDVVRDERGAIWLLDSFGTWQSPDSTCEARNMRQRLTLLVDGETRTVVSS